MPLNDVLFWVILIALFILFVFVVPQWLLMRNVPKVIRLFRENNAVGAHNAKTIEELGLKSKSMFERAFRMRDYKPRALQFLIRVTIVDMTEEGKVYLDEDKLLQTRWRTL